MREGFPGRRHPATPATAWPALPMVVTLEAGCPYLCLEPYTSGPLLVLAQVTCCAPVTSPVTVFLQHLVRIWTGAPAVAGRVHVCDRVRAVTELTLILSSLGPSTWQSA